MATTLLGLKDLCPFRWTVLTTNICACVRVCVCRVDFSDALLSFISSLVNETSSFTEKKCLKGLFKDTGFRIAIFMGVGQDARFVVCN